jgi:hypothetical protein
MLFNGDCLEIMKTLDDKSIDLVFCDLPYGQTCCKWDCKIDLEEFWKQIMRIKKLNTPLFFTTTTKFGVELIQSAPKKCFFRYDLVWVKSAPAGFLCAKKMPMRKHEMVYVFYEKLPFYDLSRHTHKFIKEIAPSKTRKVYGAGDGKNCGSMFDKDGKSYFKSGKEIQNRYDPPLPVSVIKKVERKSTYGNIETHDLKTGKNNGVPRYDPPLPVSVVKEPEPEPEEKNSNKNSELYGQLKDNGYYHKRKKGETTAYDPPLPVSVVKEETTMVKDFTPNKNGNIYDCPDNQEFAGRNGAPRYDPPLPTSVVKEVKEGGLCKNYSAERLYYYDENGKKLDGSDGTNTKYDPPLPTSVVKDDITITELEPEPELIYGENAVYDPPLPNTLLEINSTRGKHSTEKPVALMEWILSYYSKEGDIILDPTMGSGSTGVACKNLNRKFIGIEKDPDIFEVAKSRNPEELVSVATTPLLCVGD